MNPPISSLLLRKSGVSHACGDVSRLEVRKCRHAGMEACRLYLPVEMHRPYPEGPTELLSRGSSLANALPSADGTLPDFCIGVWHCQRSALSCTRDWHGAGPRGRPRPIRRPESFVGALRGPTRSSRGSGCASGGSRSAFALSPARFSVRLAPTLRVAVRRWQRQRQRKSSIRARLQTALGSLSSR